ncbi:hypothetical protein ACFWVC_10490 [Streptomyces sp. NPDC058691]|uniref:hypothetical protein n=1 Tax=Streptomyces sp. NPDC058691 TaxID=3346601 RepID=UPI003666C8FB
MTAGGLVWLVAALGGAGSVSAPLILMALSLLAVFRGWQDLRKARRPFRLRIDGFGITLHDAELAWEQIEAVALWHVPNTGENSEETTPPKPRLTLWTMPGVTLPRKADRTWDGRTRYTLVDCEDLDQSVTEVTTALAGNAGARFETAPRAVRPPIPVTVSGPERSVPGGEQVFVHAGRSGTWALVWAAPAVVFTYSFWELVHGRIVGPEPFAALGPLGAIGCWCLAGRSYFRWRKPLRLRIGPAGISMREVTEDEQHFAWPDIAAVTVGESRATTDKRPWLVVWPLPGTRPGSNASYLVDGHQAYALVRLDRLPGGAEAVVPVLRAYAGERYSETV